jgi:hypothetical protein
VKFAAALVLLPVLAWAQEDEGIHVWEPSEEISDAGTAPVRPEPVEGRATEPAIEQFEPVSSSPAVESFTPAPAGPEVHFSSRVGAELGLDTRFESPRGTQLAENVVEGRVRLGLGVDVKLTDWLRVVLESRAQLRGAAQQGMDRFKGFFEPMLGDAYIDLYLPRIDLRIGNQRIPLGANALFAPADVLNPRDLRESFLRGEPEDTVLPVFALRARGEIGKVNWLLAYAPFHTPSKYAVFGQDEALMQPPLAQAFDTAQISPTVEDKLQERIIETEVPPPFLGDVAVHLDIPARVKVGLTWAWINEKLPRVIIDPELQSVLDARAAGRQPDAAALVSLSNRFEAGEKLYRGYYLRQHVFSLEGTLLAGPVQIDADVAYSPRVTWFDPSFKPLDKPQLSWTLGVSSASDIPFKFAVSYVGMVVFDVGAREQLVLLEPATAVGAPRVAWLHLFFGTASYPVWKDRFLLELRAAFEVVQKSFAIAPRITFQGVDNLGIWVTAEFYEGSPWSPIGYFGRNDKVVVGFTWKPL